VSAAPTRWLNLLRHAKSDWSDPSAADFDRRLNKRGERSARLVGAELRRRNIRFDMIFASPARRVRETLEELRGSYGPMLEPRFDESLYLASSRSLLEHVRHAPDCSELLPVGHNPGLQELALDLVAENDGHFTDLQAKFPTGALLRMRVDATKWTELGPGKSAVEFFLKPRELDS
jgi:phosphohistidine phosphatase